MGSGEPHGSAILGCAPEGLLVLRGPPSASGIVTCQRGRPTQWQIFVYKEVNSSDIETHQELRTAATREAAATDTDTHTNTKMITALQYR